MLHNALLKTFQTISSFSIRREKRSIANRTGSTKFHSAHSSYSQSNSRCTKLQPDHRPVLSPARLSREYPSSLGATNECRSKRLSISAAPDRTPAFATLTVDPCYSIDDQKRAHVVTHRATPLDNPSLSACPSLFLRHR